MTWTGIGIVLELLGLAIAAWGLSRTWRQFAPPGSRILGHQRDQVSRAWRVATDRLRAAWAKLTGQRRETHAKAAAADALIVIAHDARAVVSYGPLDGLSPEEAIDRLASRTVELRESLNRLDEREHADVAELRGAVDRVRADLEAAAGSLKKLSTDVATEGTGIAALGLALTFAGVVLQQLG